MSKPNVIKPRLDSGGRDERIVLPRKSEAGLALPVPHSLTFETWPVQVADERMLEVFDNDSMSRILLVRRRDCVTCVELRRRLSLTSIPALFVQRRLRWFGHAARRPEGELIKDLFYPHHLAHDANELEAS